MKKKADATPNNAPSSSVPPARVTSLPHPVEEPVGVYYPRQPVGVYPQPPIYSGPVGMRYAGVGGFRGGFGGGGFRGPIGFGGRGFRRF
jgi:hypothetical protein